MYQAVVFVTVLVLDQKSFVLPSKETIIVSMENSQTSSIVFTHVHPYFYTYPNVTV